MKNKFKRIFVFLLTIIILLKNLFLLPYEVTGGFAGINEIKHLPIIMQFINDNSCIDCFQYSLLIKQAVLESVVIVILYIIITTIALKLLNKKK